MNTPVTKTYAESAGRPPFDWNLFLRKKRYTEQEMEKACQLSCAWVTCAVGNLCDAIPRGRGGIPVDARLHYLGNQFTKQINHSLQQSWLGNGGSPSTGIRLKCLKTLAAIEQRSTQLLNPTSSI
jgi:hypothetical protein